MCLCAVPSVSSAATRQCRSALWDSQTGETFPRHHWSRQSLGICSKRGQGDGSQGAQPLSTGDGAHQRSCSQTQEHGQEAFSCHRSESGNYLPLIHWLKNQTDSCLRETLWDLALLLWLGLQTPPLHLYSTSLELKKKLWFKSEIEDLSLQSLTQ